MSRVNKNTIAWWIRHFGFVCERWDGFERKWGILSLSISCYNPADPQSQHTFDF